MDPGHEEAVKLGGGASLKVGLSTTTLEAQWREGYGLHLSQLYNGELRVFIARCGEHHTENKEDKAIQQALKDSGARLRLKA